MQFNRATQFAYASGQEAVRNSGISAADIGNERTAILIGGLNPTPGADLLESVRDFIAFEERNVNPITLLSFMPHAAVSHLSISLGARGPGYAIQSGCASATQAIGESFRMIARGDVDRALTGGADSSLGLYSWRAWEGIGALATETCRPFSRDRDGTIIGEGGAMFLLEAEEAAKARGALVLAEIIGYHTNSDAFDMTKPSQASVENLIGGVLKNASLSAQDVQHVNAHASGTKLNDSLESAAIHAVFGEHAKRLLVSGTKAMHGHLMTACGAVETAATIFALERQFAPGTLNHREADPECNLNVLPNKGCSASIDYALNLSLGFGGTNAALAFRRA